MKARTIAEPETLSAAYERCRQLHARYGRTYYLATLLLPRWKRPHVHALYGFARYADEIVDDLASTLDPPAKAAALHAWGQRLLAGLQGGPVNDPVLPAVLHTVRAFGLDPGRLPGPGPPGQRPPTPPPGRGRPPPPGRPGRRPHRTPRHHHHPRRPMTLRVALALAVVVAAADGFLLWGRGLATPVSPERAAASFLTGRPAAAGDLPGPRPPAGVYRYRTSGHERVDRFGIDRAYPAETARVISWRGGCRWRETVPIFTQHTETYDFCAAGTDAADFAYSTSLTYFLVPGVQRFACAPVGRRLLSGQRPGAARRWRCVQGASRSANTTVYVGPETVQTAAGPVATRHLRLITALSGQSSGGAVRELWLDPDGLVVKEERQVSLRVRATFVGVLTYEERASFLLSGRP